LFATFIKNLRNLTERKISNYPYFGKWLILGTIVGIVAGFGALGFYYSIKLSEDFFMSYLLGMSTPHPTGEGGNLIYNAVRPYLIPIIVALGGLISGFLVFKFAPEAEGHGTDAAIDAYHRKQGKIRWRVIPIKTFASAITIGSGGSAGREGPTAQIAAGIGSLMADLLKLSVEDRRRMVAIGIGAGIGTIFKAPIGGALLAAEVLYRRDLQPDVIYPAFVASAIGYSIFGSFEGFVPIFGYYLAPFNPLRLPMYAVLGLICGLLAILYPKIFYYTHDKFKSLKISNYYKPVIGAFGAGLLALLFPEIMGTGYGWIQMLMEGKLELMPSFGIPLFVILLALPIVKIIATSLTIASGGSGGVFAPGMFIGAFIGLDVGLLFQYIYPTVVHGNVVGAFVIIGMLSFFGGAGKVPLAVTMMVVEMTGGLQLLPAAMIAVSISYLVSGNYTIYHAQVPTRKDSPAHAGEYNMPILTNLKVTDIENFRNISIHPDADVKEAKALMTQNSVSSIPVSNQGHFLGAIYMYDIYQLNGGTVRTFMKTGVPSIKPNASLEEAWEIMNTNKSTWVPVVLDGAFLGIITMTDILDVYKSKLKSLGISGESGG
jgi:CIC family chloride channel protein